MASQELGATPSGIYLGTRAVRCEVQVRWADVDALGHINNVAYAVYFDDAHRRLLVARSPRVTPGGSPVVIRRQEITYLSPLMFGSSSTIATRAHVDHAGPTQVVLAELFGDVQDGERLYARSKAVLGTRPDVSSGELPSLDPSLVDRAHHYQVAVRFAEVSADGGIADTAVFEYLQEARIALMEQMGIDPTSTVVAQKNVDFHRPALRQPDALELWSWVSRVGNRSATIDSVVTHRGIVFACGSSTLVFYDIREDHSVVPSEPVVRALRARQL